MGSLLQNECCFAVPTPGNPFGTWYQMADMEAVRWYPTVRHDTTTAHRAIIIGGTNYSGPTNDRMEAVNSYEVARPVFNSQPIPSLRPVPQDFDRKPNPTSPTWPTWTNWLSAFPAASDRLYWGPEVPFPAPVPAFSDYPRLHALGFLDPITGGTAPRLFVSGFASWGMRWAHDQATDPAFGNNLLTGQGYDLGQYPAFGDFAVLYPTSLLLPGTIGGISTQVARIGGYRLSVSNQASDLVETASVNSGPSSWQSGAGGSIPPMASRRHLANVVMLPTGDLFAIGGENAPGSFNLIPELLTGGTWAPMAAHVGARDYHSTAILLPDARVFVCGGEARKQAPSVGTDYIIWEPPYFHLDYGSLPPTGITVRDATTGAIVLQDALGPPSGMQYGRTYWANWTNTLEDGITVNSVVLMRPPALTHHDDGGQRLVRLVAWDDSDQTQGPPTSIKFLSPASTRHAAPGWWMLFLVNSGGRPSQAYWVHLS